MSDVVDTFRLVVPQDARHVSTVRIFAAAVARTYGSDEDTVEDLKVGISEACGMWLRDAADDRVDVTASPTGDRLVFEVTGGVPAGWPDHDRDTADTPTPTSVATILSREMLAALFEDASVERRQDRGAIRFSVGTSGTR